MYTNISALLIILAGVQSIVNTISNDLPSAIEQNIESVIYDILNVNLHEDIENWLECVVDNVDTSCVAGSLKSVESGTTTMINTLSTCSNCPITISIDDTTTE